MKEKVISIESRINSNQKLNLDACKQLINVNGNSYTDEEVLKIRGYLYQLAEIECRYFKEWQATNNDNVISINNNYDNSEKSIPLYPGEHRRTG